MKIQVKRHTTEEISNLIDVKTGHTVFDSDLNKPFRWDGGEWIELEQNTGKESGKKADSETAEQRLMTSVKNIEGKVNFLYGWTIFTIIISAVSIIITLIATNQ